MAEPGEAITECVSFGAMTVDYAEFQAMMTKGFGSAIPHNRALGVEILSVTPGEAILKLPYHVQLVGNPATGVLHGGAITALMDAGCGAAVFMKLSQPMPIATLDLRIDYLKPATPPRDVFAHATCYRTTRSVAFVRAVAYHDDESDLIASAAATFIVGVHDGPSRDPAKDVP